MKKIYVVIIALVIIGFGYHYFSSKSQLNKVMGDATAECSPKTNATDKNNCYWSYAMKSSSLKICDQILTTETKDDCYRAIARTEKKTSICDQIANAESKGFCYFDLAQVKKDQQICRSIENNQDYALSCQKCVTGQLTGSSCAPVDRTPVNQ